MTKKYLTISEFAGLRNININSLRYYEKLQLLTPAYIDPKTKYRYYLPEQLGILDAISLCITLGIPLKNLKRYVDENGRLDEKGILEDGKKAMQKKISEMQTGLEITQFNLHNMNENQKYSSQTGIYTREIEERFFIKAPFDGNWDDISEKEKTAIDLFHSAQEQNMAPVFPAGILISYETNPATYSFIVRVLHPSEKDSRIIRIPKATFFCRQVDLTSQTDIQQLLRESFPLQKTKNILISNMSLSKVHFNSRHSEIQIPAAEGPFRALTEPNIS